MRVPAPLRTVHGSFPSYGSSIGKATPSSAHPRPKPLHVTGGRAAIAHARRAHHPQGRHLLSRLSSALGLPSYAERTSFPCEFVGDPHPVPLPFGKKHEHREHGTALIVNILSGCPTLLLWRGFWDVACRRWFDTQCERQSRHGMIFETVNRHAPIAARHIIRQSDCQFLVVG